jgi:hypothetical protein
VSGRLPFAGDNQVTVALAQVRDQPPPLPADVPPGLAGLIREAMAKQPERRPADGGEFGRRARALAGAGGQGTAPLPGGRSAATVPLPAGSPPAAPPVSSTPAAPTPTRLQIGNPVAAYRNRRRVALAASAIVLAAGIAGGALVARELLADDGQSSATVPSVPVDPASVTSVATTTSPPTTVATTTTTPPATTTTQPTTTSSTLPPTSAPVEVKADDYIGEKADDVVETLEDLGFKVDVKHVEADRDQRDLVVDIEPSGTLEYGSEITLSVGARKGDDGDD